MLLTLSIGCIATLLMTFKLVEADVIKSLEEAFKMVGIPSLCLAALYFFFDVDVANIKEERAKNNW